MTATITKTERRLLALLERFCFQDGKIYPKRTTIAAKLGIKPRQVSNLVASLVKKGFIAVVPAGLLDRHLYGKGTVTTCLTTRYMAKLHLKMHHKTAIPPFIRIKG